MAGHQPCAILPGVALTDGDSVTLLGGAPWTGVEVLHWRLAYVPDGGLRVTGTPARSSEFSG